MNRYFNYFALLLALAMLLSVMACAPVQAPAPAEPAAEEPAAEEPAAEQPAAEEPAAEQPAAEEPAAGEQKVYYEMTALANLPYFIDHQVGLKFAGKALDAETKYVGPLDYDMTAMVNAFEQAIAENPDGINVIGFDAAL